MTVPNALTPLAVSSEPLLRALQATPDANTKALAEASGKKPNNIARDLDILANAGLIVRHPPRLLGAGLDALAAIDRANGGEDEPANPAGFVFLRHDQIVPDRLNPRKTFDEDAVDALRQSILQDGLLQNLVVRPAQVEDDGRRLHRLVAGEMRWRAIAAAKADGDWPDDRRIPCKVADVDDLRHSELALIENLRRKDLSPLEEAHGFKLLCDAHGLGTAAIAEKISMTQRFVQQRLQLLELSETQQASLEAGKINIEEARRLLAGRPKPLEMAAEHRLVLLEVAARSLTDGDGSRWTQIDVDAGAAVSPEILSFLFFSDDWTTAHRQVRLNYLGWSIVARIVDREPATADAIAAAIEALRAELGLDATAGYATPWLNAPVAIDPEMAERIEARKRENEERNQRRIAEQETRRAAQVRAANGRAEIFRRLREPNAVIAPAALPAMVEPLGNPLPWKFIDHGDEDEGELLDANGEEVNLYGDDAFVALCMVTMNRAAGFAPIFEQAAEPSEDEDDAEEGDAEEGAGAEAPEPAEAMPCAAPAPRLRSAALPFVGDQLSQDIRAAAAAKS